MSSITSLPGRDPLFFQALDPVAVIYTSSLNVPPRNFTEGFPGVTDRFEWFAIDYSGRFWVEKPGLYQFALTSDDGSKLYIDDELIIDNDGVHAPEVKMGRIGLSGGIHRIRVSYFQGPRDEVALTLEIAPPGEAWRMFSTDEFKPPANPETWHFNDPQDSGVSPIAQSELHLFPREASRGDRVSAKILLQSRDGREIAGLRWKVVVPAQVLELIGSGSRPGSSRVAEDSGEQVRCTKEKVYLYACKLAAHPIANGSIATFDFKVLPGTKAQTVAVRIENIVVTAVDGQRWPVSDAEGLLTIR